MITVNRLYLPPPTHPWAAGHSIFHDTRTAFMSLIVIANQLVARAQRMLAGNGDTAGRNALLVFIIRVASAGILYLSHAFLARLLGTTEFGLFVYVWVWVTVLGTLSTFGFNTTVLRFIPEYSHDKKDALLVGVIRRSRRFVLAASAIVALIGIAVVQIFPQVVGEDHLVAYTIGFLCVPLFASAIQQEYVARTFGWIAVAFLPTYIVRPLLLLAGTVALVLSGQAATAVVTLCVAGTAALTTLSFQVVALNRRLRSVLPTVKPRYRIKDWLLMSFPTFLVDALFLSLSYIDIVMLQAMKGPNDVAIYYAATKTGSFVSFIYFSIAAVTTHRFAAQYAANDLGALSDTLKWATRWIFWPTCAATLFFILAGKPILWLFGPEFQSGYWALVILLTGLLIRSAFGPAEHILNMTGNQNLTAIALFATIGLNIVLNYMLIPLYGLEGAAIATSTSIIFAAVTLASLINLRVGVRPGII